MFLPALSDVKEITFPCHPSMEAVLTVFESPPHVPFAIERIFTIDASRAGKRGAHAHRACQQILVCLKGKIALVIKDGLKEKAFALDSAQKGILIPAGLWAEQEYEAGSLLMVLASHRYDEKDYIRDYNAFLKLREQNK
ncbi:MAG: WxcM-like domain-containing protein [Proteobacteria bacterium]|nr:WxcM-like domain-containing protein [Pseudomonadota bacterium]